ncbi:hypothetical protein GTA51_09830 [Desulfovibrio aerotolerans]|uniref:Uncharacterized protein n=1 Tax=Solidesulfovibrio aerotolerans TaxID=295255 RepID=A0A7C9ILP8_9BACT|nr:hypothetical protein [Solidesulfovibrio aerotolerans]MYL83424.1 hypothetical protein [Solidesulfovibrio aerotolerans]
MQWITFIIAGGLLAGFLAALIALTAKHQNPGVVPGGFNFDRYKASELSQRGLFDKTRWR